MAEPPEIVPLPVAQPAPAAPKVNQAPKPHQQLATNMRTLNRELLCEGQTARHVVEAFKSVSRNLDDAVEETRKPTYDTPPEFLEWKQRLAQSRQVHREIWKLSDE